MLRHDRPAPPAPAVTVNMAAALLVLLAGGCDGSSGEETQTTPAAAPVAALSARRWLEPADGIPPGQWLASRAAGHDVPAAAPEAVRLDALLDRADRVFDESPRMIANRALQVQEMLAGLGIAETPGTIIADLLDVVSPSGAQGFGAVCQHYVNLRGAGFGRDEALDRLRLASGGTR